MVGENVSNAVDEEVHDNDGAERNEAQEASAVYRRAIADADQAGQLDISGEAKTARILRTTEPPTDAPSMAHNATHVPFRDWCPICVASCCEQDGGYTAEIPDRLHVHSNSGRERGKR